MSRPLVGIVVSMAPDPNAPQDRDVYFVGKPYIDAVQAAGGAPFLVPHGADAADYVPLIDGWLIIGGNDIDPAQYGQTLHPEAKLEPGGRFALEKQFFETAPAHMPVLGICYGCQFLNVARGGNLVQHLPDVVGHGHHSGGTEEQYRVDAGSKAGLALGAENVTGKSYHHQAVSHVGEGLKVVARSADGTVEALEDESDRWLVGVQWHPERTPEDSASQRLFRRFVEEAARYKESKASCGTW